MAWDQLWWIWQWTCWWWWRPMCRWRWIKLTLGWCSWSETFWQISANGKGQSPVMLKSKHSQYLHWSCNIAHQSIEGTSMCIVYTPRSNEFAILNPWVGKRFMHLLSLNPLISSKSSKGTLYIQWSLWWWWSAIWWYDDHEESSICPSINPLNWRIS